MALALIANTPLIDKARDEVASRQARVFPLDSTTPERMVKAGAHIDTSASGVQRLSEAPFDWMAHRRLITMRQFEAGDRFRTNAMVAKAEATVGSVDWNSSGVAFGPKMPSMFTSQAIANARQRYRQDIDAVGTRLVRIVTGILIEEWTLEKAGKVLCGYKDRRAAIAAAGSLLRVALDILADHYRLRESSDQRRKRSVWRAPDAKPVDTGQSEIAKPVGPDRNPHKGGSS